MSYYSIKGGVVAFACNPAGNGNGKLLYSDLIASSMQTITNACGWYIAGATKDSDNVHIGYQNMFPGADFCGNWNKGIANHC